MAREFGLSQLPDKRVSDWVEQRWQKQDSTGLVNISLYSLSNEYSSRGQAKKLALLQIVQANDSTAIVASWEDFRSRLLEAINVARLFSDTGTSEHLRIINSDQFAGYSLVYGANSTSLLISPDRSPKRLAADLQKVVKGLSGRDVEKPIRLETENISDAHHTALLSLINVPTGLERDAGIIYWMIKDEDDSIFVKWCLSPHSRLSQVETLAHKTFAHSYQLKLLRPRWEETIERLLLNNTNLHDIAELDNTVSSLDSINNNVGSLLRIHPIAEAANSTIHQQLANMAIVRNQLYDNAIFQYLELLMRNDSNDAQLYTEKLRAINSSMQATINFYRFKLAQKDEKNQNRLQTSLTFFGLLLGILQVFDTTSANKLIQDICPASQPTYWAEFAVRVAISLLTAAIATKAATIIVTVQRFLKR